MKINLTLNVIGAKEGEFTKEDGSVIKYYQLKYVDNMNKEHILKCSHQVFEDIVKLHKVTAESLIIADKSKLSYSCEGSDGFAAL